MNKQDNDVTLESSDDNNNAEKSDTAKKTKTIKQVLIICITFIICLSVIMYSLSVNIEKYFNVKTDAATADIKTVTPTDFSDNVTSSTALVTDNTEVPSSDVSVSDVSDAAGLAVTSVDSTSKKAVDNKLDTTAEIIDYYNASANSVKKNAKSIKQNYQRNTSNGTLDVGGSKILAGIGNSLMNSFLGDDKNRTNVTYKTLEEKNAGFPVDGKSWTSKLTAQDVKIATCSLNNDIYTIVILIKPDTTPLKDAGDGHAGKGVTILKASDIVKYGSSVPGGITNVALTYSNCKITVKIQKLTGRMIYGNYYTKARLALTAMRTDCSLGLIFESDYTINW